MISLLYIRVQHYALQGTLPLFDYKNLIICLKSLLDLLHSLQCSFGALHDKINVHSIILILLNFQFHLEDFQTN